MILIAVLVILAGAGSATWGIYNFWKHPLAAALAVVVSFVLVGIGMGLAGQLGGR